MSSHTQLFIDGLWRDSGRGETLSVLNPSTGDVIGTVSRAVRSDLDLALHAAQKGFLGWRKIAAFDRCKLMRRAAELIRSRADAIARVLTLEQGKPLAEAKTETLNGADLIDWFAEDCKTGQADSLNVIRQASHKRSQHCTES